MEGVLPWLERDPELSFFIRLCLDDFFSLGTVNCQNSLVRLIRALLPNLHNRAHRTDKDLSFDAAVCWLGFRGTGGKDKDQYTQNKFKFHQVLFSFYYGLFKNLFCSPVKLIIT